MDVNMTGVNSYGSDSDVGGVLNSTAMNGNNLQPNGVYIADAIITGLSITGSIVMILPFLISLQMRKLRHRLIFSLGISNLFCGLSVFIPTVYYLSGHRLRNNAPGCQTSGFIYLSMVIQGAFCTLCIAVATYTVLAHPLSRLAAFFEKPWAIAVIFSFFLTVGITLAIIGETVYTYADYGGFCFVASHSSYYGNMVLFLPRSIVFLVVIILYVKLFFFFRRPRLKLVRAFTNDDTTFELKLHGEARLQNGQRRKSLAEKSVDLISEKSTGLKNWLTRFNEKNATVGGNRKESDATLVDKASSIETKSSRLKRFNQFLDTNVVNSTIPRFSQSTYNTDAISPTTLNPPPADQSDPKLIEDSHVVVVESSSFSSSSLSKTVSTESLPDLIKPAPEPTPPSQTHLQLSSFAFPSKASSLPSTPASHTADLPSPDGPPTIVTDRSPTQPNFNLPSRSPSPSFLEQGDTNPSPRRNAFLNLFTSSLPPPSISKEHLALPYRPIQIPSSQEIVAAGDRDRRRGSAFRLKSASAAEPTEVEDEQLDFNMAVNSNNGPEEIGLDNSDRRRRMSAQEMNRKASILMLLYPIAYLLLFSISVGRQINDLANPDHPPNQTLAYLSRYFIFATGFIDAFIFVLIEFSFKFTARNRV